MDEKPLPSGDDRRLYRAPALEKGLDVLELLAGQDGPLTVSAIVQLLGRSTGELFRMIQVLEHRGFVVQTRDGYVLTSKLFQLGLQRPQMRNLIECALPHMRELSAAIGQSCHLGFHSDGELVVVARMEARGQIGYSVRVGHRRPLHLSTSGTVLYAWQSEEVQTEWEAMMRPEPSTRELASFRKVAEGVRERGFAQMPSALVEGITDLSVPLLRGGRAAAALTVPFVRLKQPFASAAETLAALHVAAAAISSEMLLSDNRV